jgi:hypothetical protein
MLVDCSSNLLVFEIFFCFMLQQKTLAATGGSVSSSTPTIVNCTVTGNSTRRRRQSQ